MARIPPWIPFSAALLALAAYLTAPVSDPRFFFHLAAGHEIGRTGRLPVVDPWTLAGAGKPWLDGSWLFDFAISRFEEVLGGRAMSVLALLATSAFVIAFGTLSALLAGELVMALLVTTLVACGCLERAELSPELVSWSLLSVGTLLSVGRFRPFARCLGLFVCAGLLANLHSSYLLLPFVVLFLLDETAATRLLSLAAIVLAAVVSPYHGRQVLQWSIELTREMELSVRFQDTAANIYLFSFAFLFLLWMIFLLIAPARERLPARGKLLFAGALSIGGLIHRDLLPYSLMFVGVLLASTFRTWCERQPDASDPQLVDAFRRMTSSVKKIPAAGGVWLLFCLFVVNAVSMLRTPLIDVYMPRRAVDFILEHQLPGPLLNERAIGPYLVYRFSQLARPDAPKPSFDERLPLFSRELAVAERSLRTLQTGWEKTFSELSPQTVLCRKGSPLWSYLAASPAWTLVFQEEPIPDAPVDDIEGGAPARPKSSFLWMVFTKRADR